MLQRGENMDAVIEQSIKDTLFKTPCISCGGFVFLIHIEKIETDEAEGIIFCPDCDIKNKAYFYLVEKEL